MSVVVRCSWAEGDALMRHYHDTEWGVPEYDSRRLWAQLVLETFQAGLSWRVILHKRENFRRAFAGLDPGAIAAFTAADVERLCTDATIVRSRAKIVATIGNARAYQAMQAAGEDFSAWAWARAGDPAPHAEGVPPARTAVSRELSRALKRRGFKFVGPTVVQAWMQAAGMVDGHVPGCFRHQQSESAPAGDAARRH